MRRKNRLLCFVLAFSLLLGGCSAGTYTQSIIVGNSVLTQDGEDNLFEYNQDGEFNYKTEDELAKENAINSPDVQRYAAKFTYNSLGENVMPIGAYIEPKVDDPRFKITMEEALTDFALSGCNIMTCVNYFHTNTIIEEMMGYAEQLGFLMLLKHGGINSLPNKVSSQEEATQTLYLDLNKYYKMKSFAGLHVADEPGYLDWQVNSQMPKAREYFENAMNSKLFFVNLLPIYSPSWAFPEGPDGHLHGKHDLDYMKYYQYYMDDVKPQVVCYDYYPCVGAFPSLLGEYFKQMAIIKQFSDNASYAGEAGVPFWTFIQVSDWGGGRDVTYSEIAWQANTSLALGAKGLQYYTYNSSNGNDSNSMVTIEGYKNRSYYDGQKVNAQVLAVDEWLLNCTLQAVIQSGVTPNGETMPSYFNPVKTYGRIASSADVPHLIGCMNYYENNVVDPFVTEVPYEVYYVVNNTITSDGNVTIQFTEAVSGEYIVNAERISFENKNELTVNLGAGEGFALKLDRRA